MFKSKRRFILLLSLLYILFVSCVGVSEYRQMINMPVEKIAASDPAYLEQNEWVSTSPDTAANNAVVNTPKPNKQKPVASMGTPAVPSRSKPIKGLAILMYHEIGEGPNSLYVPVQNFREQMLYLHTNGYKVVSLLQAKEMIYKNENTSKVVAITFDDGYQSFYSLAWPILKEYGYPATLFTCSNLVGKPQYCTWDELKELKAAGIEVGSHTQTHPSLPSLDVESMTKEVTNSKKDLETNLGIVVSSFSYPCGEFDKLTIDAVSQAGYAIAVTTNNSKATSKDFVLLVPRIRVPSRMSLEIFAKSIV